MKVWNEETQMVFNLLQKQIKKLKEKLEEHKNVINLVVDRLNEEE